MLVAGVVELVALRPIGDRSELGACLRGWLYDALAAVDPALVDALHDNQTASPLSAAILPVDNDWLVPVRVSAIEARLSDRLLLAVERVVERGSLVRLGQADLEVRRATFNPRDTHWAGVADLLTLNQSRAADRWEFEFVTPTCHKVDGVHQPLPVPRSLWTSWLGRWNEYAPDGQGLRADLLEVFSKSMVIESIDLASNPMRDKTGYVVGYRGRVFVGGHQVPEWAKAQLNALAGFSFWSGTGIKTLAGMGLTRHQAWRGRQELRPAMLDHWR